MFSRTVSLGALASLLLSVPAMASDYRVTGKAYALGNWQSPVYEERYTPRTQEGRAEVHYVDVEEERIALKTLDYSRGDIHPSYRLEDHRLDRLWAAEWSSDDRITLKRGDISSPETETVTVKVPQVIDAGFDPFIQQSWDSLLAGDRVTFHFAFPNRLTNVKLRAEQIRADDSPLHHKKSDWVYFRIRVDSALLSLFADDLYLAYAKDGKRLMVFRGRSNIPDENGEGRDVEIRYHYPSD
ncbi:hypothetical protein [Marinimicrobium agarilyticum]|uniref:hypothetical protein n=1 Tax=Marinimicrobium agarilyticum TaxID=306546 RepID=UPI00040C411A|nr:hypothetical protein [Marinimicrobium agarilyticum]